MGAAVGAGIMVLLVAAAAGLAGSLSATGPRWLPDLDGDSRFVADPAPTPTDAYALPLLPEPDGGEPARNLLPVVLVVLAVVVALVAWYVWRRWSSMRITRPAAQPGAGLGGTLAAGVDAVPAAATTAVDAPTVRHGLERALDELDSDRSPTDAVVAAWQGLEEAAGRAGVRRAPAQTPTELTARIIAREPEDAAVVKELLAVYLRVRFGDAPATAADVDTARRCLRTLAASWRVPRRGEVVARSDG